MPRMSKFLGKGAINVVPAQIMAKVKIMSKSQETKKVRLEIFSNSIMLIPFHHLKLNK